MQIEGKDLFTKKTTPSLIKIPKFLFLMVDGKGDPNGDEYQHAVSLLYALSFTIKMSKMRVAIPGYNEYKVSALEGLWWCDERGFDFYKRDNWLWTSMIRQPEFVTPEVFQWAAEIVKKKKPELNTQLAYLQEFDEGLCVQMMHIGPFSTEPESVLKMQEFMKKNNLIDETGAIRKHHEIYLSDPRKVKPENYKTIIRHPVK